MTKSKTPKKPKTDAELISDFSSGIEEGHYTSVLMQSPNFVIFRIKGHTAWASVGARAYVKTQHILIRKGDWWVASGKPNRRWEGRVSNETLKEALRRSEIFKTPYEGDLDVPMCQECDLEMNYGEGDHNGTMVGYYRCDECGWSIDG